jgi:hypothetical protein
LRSRRKTTRDGGGNSSCPGWASRPAPPDRAARS